MELEGILYIDFILSGTTIPPKEISKKTGITPDSELMRGERNQKLILPRLNIWSIKSHVQSNEVADHWHDLESTLLGAKETIREIAQTGNAKLTIVIQTKQRVPPIMVPPSMSAFAGFVNAVIEIDHLQ
ncbi:MAG: DUF4279 domain-containing protein [Gallionella sp.]|nr:DUF4279 domain-containing protein [Gallionella sp.]MDD4960530.1 DUF4279 domain-containing protein [Gallionella sp.]